MPSLPGMLTRAAVLSLAALAATTHATEKGMPTTAASATLGWATRALSISAVPMRWPETLSTSSTRPVIQ